MTAGPGSSPTSPGQCLAARSVCCRAASTPDTPGDEVMDLETLARLIRDMRQHQVAFFTTKSQAELAASKDYERRVDQAVKDVLHPPAPGLFDAPACDHAWAPAGNGGYICSRC